ncbi:hypothetical protein B0187_01205 [Haemophilus paracuniculus]|uniref:Uncharacterized protein n=1 Tax=Haemophilus paracuniculus TaxID=734 RepID=A0A1T0AVA2_9PAST|nr:hypothetical protein [Haemophilus paracuniculus]OOS00553.1 hypothetical protein B0187_01205 [Haemophilus paracuniculus]
MKKFSEIQTNKQLSRALQIWQILVGIAMNRQTITYQKLSNLMFHKNAMGVLGPMLEPVSRFCNENGLPPLTAIVVNAETGLSGDGIPTEQNLNEAKEQVFKFDWYDIFPPTIEELEQVIATKKAEQNA